MWDKEILQKWQKYLCTKVTNCGMNSQSFHNGLHSLRSVICNRRLAPIFTCHCSQSYKEEGWTFLFMCSNATGCWAISFNRNNNSFYWEQMLTFGGCSSGGEKRKGDRQSPCVLWRVPLVLFDNSSESLGSPPENKACISITQTLMKALGLKKKKLARGECAWFS